MIVRARTIVTMQGPPIADGAVRVEGNEITAVGLAQELVSGNGHEVLDLGDQVLMPGLINAHCHLDYTMMRHAISPPKSFTAWVQRLNALKRSLDSEDYLRAIARGFTELQKWGTTAVCNVESFPELMTQLPPSPIRTWWFYEMIDIRHRVTSEDVVAGALSFFQHRGRSLDRFGLSPHAPYTASTMLYQMANDCAGILAMPLTTHVAESGEETAMFRNGNGALHDFMSSLNRPMNDCGSSSPFRVLWDSGAINPQWILVHLNELDEDDFRVLEALPRGGGPHVVHCPGSHRYFRHEPFPMQRLRSLGVNVCVGTDSLASTNSLSLLSELRALRETEPTLSGEALLRTITVNPARALRRKGRLGQIVAGALADLIALPVSSSVRALYDALVDYDRPIPWMMIDGTIRS